MSEGTPLPTRVRFLDSVRVRIHEARCVDCGDAGPRERLSSTYCHRCQGLLKGGSLLFGERVEAQRLETAMQALLASDLLLVLGSSLDVAPARDLLRWAGEAGIPVTIVNASPTPYDELAVVTIRTDVETVLADLVTLSPPDPP